MNQNHGAVSDRRPGHTRAFLFWIAAATLLGAGLRVYNLDVAGFWVDEMYTLYVTADVSITHNSKAMGYLPTWLGLWLSGVDPSVIPQYKLDSSAWQQHGITHTNARLGSALLGIITVPIVALASRRVLGTGGAVMLAFLLATAPWHIYWSQAARFYTLQFLFYALALLFYFSSTRERSRPQFALAMLFVVLSFLSQPTALVILGIFGADWLISLFRRRPLKLGLFEWAVGTLAVAVCAVIFLNDYFSAPEQWAQFVTFTGGSYQPAHRLLMGSVYMTGPAVAVGALGAAWAMWRTSERLVIFWLLAALLPIVAFAAWSVGNAVGLRYLLICLIGWLALAAMGADRLATLVFSFVRRSDWVQPETEGVSDTLVSTGMGRRSIASATLLSLVPLGVLVVSSAYLLLGYYTNAYGFHPRWPEAYRYIIANEQPGDVVSTRHPIVGRYYLERKDVEHLPLNREQLMDLAAGGQRVWMVVEGRGDNDNDIDPWIYQLVEVRKTLDISIPRPTSRVEVLLFDPARAQEAGRGSP